MERFKTGLGLSIFGNRSLVVIAGASEAIQKPRMQKDWIASGFQPSQ
jgi:hypothetical protein